MKKWIYKAVITALALAVFVSLALLPILRLDVKIGLLGVDYSANVNGPWIYRLVVKGETGEERLDTYIGDRLGSINIWDNLENIRGKVTMFLVLTGLCLLIAGAIIALVFLLDKKKGRYWIMGVAGAGFFTALFAFATLSSITRDFVSEKVSFGKVLFGGLGALADGLFDLDTLAAGLAVPSFMVAFVAVILALFIFMTVENAQEKAEQKHLAEKRRAALQKKLRK
ncbi:MAG: hypothetical protein FWG82_02800 [Oscillospiraceae bacterium]|nr:hypothetical protein [Oscillospiraceae bacterium]